MADGYEEMLATKHAAERRIRDVFQREHPHYTPPDAHPFAWGAWVGANLRLHGAHGFRERFPKQAALVEQAPGSFCGSSVTSDLAKALFAHSRGW